MPSSVLVGGIRMSLTTTSGSCSATAFCSDGRSATDADQLEGVVVRDQALEPLPEQRVVLGQQHPDAHPATLSGAPAARGGECAGVQDESGQACIRDMARVTRVISACLVACRLRASV